MVNSAPYLVLLCSIYLISRTNALPKVTEVDSVHAAINNAVPPQPEGKPAKHNEPPTKVEDPDPEKMGLAIAPKEAKEAGIAEVVTHEAGHEASVDEHGRATLPDGVVAIDHPEPEKMGMGIIPKDAEAETPTEYSHEIAPAANEIASPGEEAHLDENGLAKGSSPPAEEDLDSEDKAIIPDGQTETETETPETKAHNEMEAQFVEHDDHNDHHDYDEYHGEEHNEHTEHDAEAGTHDEHDEHDEHAEHDEHDEHGDTHDGHDDDDHTDTGHEEAHVAAHGYEFPTAKDWAAEDKQHPTMANWHNIHEWYNVPWSAVAHLVRTEGVDAVGRVLHVGCGNSSWPPEMSDAGIDALHTDKSAYIIGKLKTLHPSLKFEVADVARMPYTDKSFDAVVDKAVLDALLEAPGSPQKAATKEMFRVLRPGGVLLVVAMGPPMPYIKLLNKLPWHSYKKEQISGHEDVTAHVWFKSTIEPAPVDEGLVGMAPGGAAERPCRPPYRCQRTEL